MVAIADSRRAARRRACDLLAEKTMTCNELPRHFKTGQHNHWPDTAAQQLPIL
jgi:hypothetical protein